MNRAGSSYFGVRIPRHVAPRHGRPRGARLHGRPAHVLGERLRLLPRHDGGDRRGLARRGPLRPGEPVGARPHVRRRGREPLGRLPSRGVPGARRRAAGRGGLPQQLRLPRLLQGVGRLGARVRRRRRLLGRAGVGRRRRRSESTTRRAGRAAATTAPSGSAARSRRSGRPRCRRSARRRSSTSCARCSRTSPRAAARTRSASFPRPRAAGAADWDEVASLPGLTTLVTDPYWKHWDESAEAVRAPLRAAAARDRRPPRRRRAALGAELRARRATTSPSSRRRSRPRARRASTTSGHGATRPAAT